MGTRARIHTRAFVETARTHARIRRRVGGTTRLRNLLSQAAAATGRPPPRRKQTTMPFRRNHVSEPRPRIVGRRRTETRGRQVTLHVGVGCAGLSFPSTTRTKTGYLYLSLSLSFLSFSAGETTRRHPPQERRLRALGNFTTRSYTYTMYIVRVSHVRSRLRSFLSFFFLLSRERRERRRVSISWRNDAQTNHTLLTFARADERDGY